MANRYNTHLIRTRASYTINEIAAIFGTERKTCSRWINDEGLEVVEENAKPLLIMGSDLKKFLTEKRRKRKIELGNNEYFCFKCHKAVLATVGSEAVVKTGKTIGRYNLEQMKKTGRCQLCQSKVNRFLKVCQKELKDSR